MHNPLITVIIPSWNRAKFIGKNIESILNQDYQNFELIIVDDGSTDNTEEVVGQFTDSRIQYFKKQNEERAVARNYGQKISRGEYVNFFDSDDVAYPNHLSTAIEMINKHNNPEVFHLDFDMKNEEGKILNANRARITNINEQLKSGNVLSCNGVFIRNDIASSYEFNEDINLSASEDYLLWLQLAARYRIHHSSKTTSTIIDHNQRSVLNVNKDGLIQRKTRMIKYLFEDPIAAEHYGPIRRRLISDANSYIALHFTLANNINSKEAIPFLWKSLKADPSRIMKKRTWSTLKRMIF